MQLTIFCEGKNISFNVQDDQEAIFIQSCRDLLINEGKSPDEVAEMDDAKVLRKAIGSQDYNNYHQATRKDRKWAKVFSLENRIVEPDKDSELPNYPSAEEVFLAEEEPERVRETIYSLLPPGQADVFYFHAIKGLTFDQIGKKLGKKLDTCAHSYYDAKKNLKKYEDDIKNEHAPWLTT